MNPDERTADAQISTEEIIAGIMMDRYGMDEDDAAEVGRYALLAIVQTLAPEEYHDVWNAMTEEQP